MLDSILTKLGDVSSRYEEIESLLSQPDVTSNQEEYIKLSKEYADLSPIVNAFVAFKKAEEDLEEVALESDVSIGELSKDELEAYGRTVGIELDRRHSRRKMVRELEDYLADS